MFYSYVLLTAVDYTTARMPWYTLLQYCVQNPNE